MTKLDIRKLPLIRRARSAWLGALDWTGTVEGIQSLGGAVPPLRRRLRRPPLADLSKVRRLGILRYDGMGDMVLTSGMLRELRRNLPDARITLICRTPWADWMRTCPWVDEVVDLELSFPIRFYEQRRVLQLFHFARRRLWPLELEVLLQPGTLYWYFKSRALAWFSGAPVRMCWEDPAWGVDTGGRFHTQVLPYPQGWHETEKCFRMLEAMGLKPEGRRLDTWWTPAEADHAAQLTRKIRAGHTRLVVLALAASEEPKRWPRERYLEVICQAAQQEDVVFMALGGRDVADTCTWLAAEAPGLVTYVGQNLPLGMIWAAIAQCDLYLGNDTGFAHMAAAARVPVVEICGLPIGARLGTRGDPSHTSPHDTVCRIIRPPAGTPPEVPLDARLVPVAPVLEATLELLRLPDRPV